MKHLDEGALQALLDGEMPPAERAEAEGHLAACGSCAAALAELKGVHARFGAALAGMDVAPPVASAQMGVRRRAAAAREPRVTPIAVARKHLLRAAVLVLGVAGVAAAAVPGSPVRRLIAEVFASPDREPQAPVVQAPAEAPPAPAPAPTRPPAGVSVSPDGGSVRVILSGSAEGLRVRTRLSDGALAEVYATGPAAGARFRTAPGRVEVVGAGAGEVRIDLPRGARSAYVEVNGRVYVAKEGGRLRMMEPSVDPSGGEAVFRVGG